MSGRRTVHPAAYVELAQPTRVFVPENVGQFRYGPYLGVPRPALGGWGDCRFRAHYAVMTRGDQGQVLLQRNNMTEVVFELHSTKPRLRCITGAGPRRLGAWGTRGRLRGRCVNAGSTSQCGYGAISVTASTYCAQTSISKGGQSAGAMRIPFPIDRHVGARIRMQRLVIRIGITFQQIHKYENGTTRVVPAACNNSRTS